MFKMNFEFDRKDNSLELINAALSGLKLSGVRIADEDGYLATTTEFDRDGKPVSTSYRYGFDNIALECERNEGETLTVWRIDAEAFAKAEGKDIRSFVDQWRGAHPDRALRTVTQISFDSADAFIVAHHEREA